MIDHNFKKKFGQNFLQDNNIIRKIVETANIEKDSLIIEIGPGRGALTKHLVEKAQVLAYEIDIELKDYLEKEFENNTVDFIFEDFLQRNIKDDIKKYKYNKLYVVANLPYYITTPIITKLIEEKIDLEKMVIMVQKEVGERFSATKGTKDYSSITVFLNYFFKIKKEFIVSKNAFIPKPNVDSIIISLNKKENKPNVIDENHFFKLVRDSFKQKRKTLKNNLKDYDFEKVYEILKRNNLSESVRAEELPLEIFVEISNNFKL